MNSSTLFFLITISSFAFSTCYAESNVAEAKKSEAFCPGYGDSQKSCEAGVFAYHTDTNSVRGTGFGGGIQFKYRDENWQNRAFAGIADDNHGRIMGNVDFVRALPEFGKTEGGWSPAAQF
jgi:hypothetical protein